MMDFSSAISKQKSTVTLSTTLSQECQRYLDDSFTSVSFDCMDDEPFCSFNEFILNTARILESAKLAKNPFRSGKSVATGASLDSLTEKQHPVITFPKYLDRLFTEGLFTRKYFHSATLYTLRALKAVPDKRSISLHKLFAIALYVAQKYMDDDREWLKKDFSNVTGIQENFLEEMEIDFCQAVGFKLYISEEQLEWVKDKSNGVPVTQIEI